MVDPLDNAHLAATMNDLLWLIDLDLAGLRQPQHTLVIMRVQTVLFLHFNAHFQFELRRQLVTVVYKEALLARSLFLFIILIDLVYVNMQAHEASQALLAEYSLSLQVTLLNELASEYVGFL